VHLSRMEFSSRMFHRTQFKVLMVLSFGVSSSHVSPASPSMNRMGFLLKHEVILMGYLYLCSAHTMKAGSLIVFRVLCTGEELSSLNMGIIIPIRFNVINTHGRNL